MKGSVHFLVFALILSHLTSCQAPDQAGNPSQERLKPYSASLSQGQSCTVFYASDGELALGGNNEDFWDPFTYVWFLPAEEGKFGRAYFGYEDFNPQGGVNDHGLFFDGLAVSQTVKVAQGNKLAYGDNLLDKAMAECASVECVLQLFDHYHMADNWDFQFLFGDSTGDSAIIEPSAIIRGTNHFQVASNFYQSTTDNEQMYDRRYEIATEMLESSNSISLELFRDILDATHQEGRVQTLYSNIYDLRNGIIYLYYFHDYDSVVVLDLNQELAKGAHSFEISSLFPRNEAADRWALPIIQAYERLLEEKLATRVDPGTYDTYVGRYEVPTELKDPSPPLIVTRDGDRLLEELPSWWKHELLPQSENSFFQISFERGRPSIDHEVTFVKDETGQVSYLITKYQGKEYVFQRIAATPAAPEPNATDLTTSLQEEKEPGDTSWAWFVAPALMLIGLAAGYGIYKRSAKQ